MRENVQRRLRELGVMKGVRELATLPSRPRVAIEDLVPGRFYTTRSGRCFIVEERYPLDHFHGSLPLSAFLDLSPETITQIAQDDTLASVSPRRACFLDTETTGLSGGTGTMAFVVGLGFFVDSVEAGSVEASSMEAGSVEAEHFHIRQYFLRDPGDEPAMIETLAEQLAAFEVLVSFNGIAFDVPILENRFILARTRSPTMGMPHLDLLPPARRLWRYGLPSCALGALERQVLSVLREQDDVPGGVIPFLYRDYLRTGDAREMKRVLYHNAVDILSLVTLATRLCRTFADPWAEARLNGAEFYGLGHWYANVGRPADAERAYRASIQAALAPDLRAKALRDLAHLLKRADRRAEAVAYWQQMALETTDDVLAHVELAKYFEWHAEDLSLAAGWTQAAIAQVEHWPEGEQRYITLAGLRHRLSRLERKMDKSQS